MKRIFRTIFLIIMILLSFTQVIVVATVHHGDGYNITIPASYTKIANDTFTDANGNNINVVITKLSSNNCRYTEDELNYMASLLEYDIKDIIQKDVREKYKDYYSDYEINEYFDYVFSDFQMKIINKEITTYNPNKYKCYHIVSKISIHDIEYYSEQYGTISNGDMYVLTIANSDYDELQSRKIRNVVDSFEIVDYKEPFYIHPFVKGFLEGCLKGTVLVFFACMFSIVRNCFRKSNKMENNSGDNFDEMTNEDNYIYYDENGNVSETPTTHMVRR